MSMVQQEYLEINPDRILFQKLLHKLKFLFSDLSVLETVS